MNFWKILGWIFLAIVIVALVAFVVTLCIAISKDMNIVDYWKDLFKIKEPVKACLTCLRW